MQLHVTIVPLAISVLRPVHHNWSILDIQGVSELSTDLFRYHSWSKEKLKYHVKNVRLQTSLTVTRTAVIFFT